MENNELKKALKDSKDLLKKIEAGLKKDVNNAIKFYGNCDYSKYLKRIIS